MSLATSSVITGSSIVDPALDRSNFDDDESNNQNNVHNTTSITISSNARTTLETTATTVVTTRPMDRQPQAPRRSVSPPVQRHRASSSEGKDDTLKSANINHNFNNSYDSADESVVGEDLLFISQLYGGNSNGEDKDGDAGCSELNTNNRGSSTRISFELPPPPPLRHIHEEDDDNISMSSSQSQSHSKKTKKHDYDMTRQPQRSAMRKPNHSKKKNHRNVHSIDNVHHIHKNPSLIEEISRGISRNHSADGTKDTRLHSVRMRGSIYPVHRRQQSIGFEETVRVQEVTPTVELNDGNTRDLWLQADEAMEIKARRRALLKHYKEREARKKKEAERMQREREKVQREQTVMNLLHPTRATGVTLNSYLGPSSSSTSTSTSTAKIQHPDLPLPGHHHSPSGRRWKATIQNNEHPHPSVMGLAVPSQGGEDLSSSISSLYMGNIAAASSFLSTSSGGSSFSGQDSFRGLEKYIDRSGKHQKNMVWDAVFLEQDEQLEFGYYDDERIANLYQSVQNQHDGQQKAEVRARKDRKAADNYLMTPRTLKLLKKTINVNTNNISDITCGNLLQDDKHENADKDKDTATSGNSGLSNHGKTCAKDDNDDTKEQETKTRKTTSLKMRIKKHSKFLRRLSV